MLFVLTKICHFTIVTARVPICAQAHTSSEVQRPTSRRKTCSGPEESTRAVGPRGPPPSPSVGFLNRETEVSRVVIKRPTGNVPLLEQAAKGKIANENRRHFIRLFRPCRIGGAHNQFGEAARAEAATHTFANSQGFQRTCR